MEKYDHKQIEQKWQKYWAENKVDQNDQSDHSREKYFMLDMLPYPSGDGLHMGHTESYTASDIMYRFKRMQGYHVMHNQAFDSFGLPAENYAVKTGVHPSETVKTAGENFLRQMKSLGLGYDYNDVYWTSSPEFYRWTQWFFSEFYKNDLIYKDTQTVNWCPSCNTTLANEQVEQGECERCKSEVIQKEIPGWYFRITQFADDLIHKEGDVIDWPEHTKKNQNNWIGKSEGAEIEFSIKGHEKKIKVFTTRPDTLFGATYMVLAPEHGLVKNVLGSSIENWDEVMTYVSDTQKKSELERLENKEKTGVQLKGIYAINPANNEEIPVFIADYVLAGYGTGAIMAVPAHDERDFEFAQQFDLPIKQVVVTCAADKNNPPQEGMAEVKRDMVIVHLRDKSTGKYALLEWHGTLEGITTAIMGGIEEGQTPEEAALMEINEEAAIPNAQVTFKSRWITAAKYCASHKKQNRLAVTYGLLAEVESLDLQGQIDATESEKHTLVWVDESEIRDRLVPEHQKQVWDLLQNDKQPLIGAGFLMNSGQFDGMDSVDAKIAITKHVGGEMTNTYRLKDWSISRQRYWGCPIPVVYDPEGNAHLVPDEHLPWELPTDVDFVPKGTAPLADSKELAERTEKLFGPGWRPEVDTMDTFVCSSWYFLRYADPQNTDQWCSEANKEYWQPVDLYIGGAEHTYMHLLYARFWIKAMKHIGLVDYDEPFLKLRHQGYVLDEHGKKMSKSKGNVVNPDDVVERFGADAVRLYMMFAGPLEDEVMWNENGVVGMYRFLEKVWRQQTKVSESSPNSIERIIHKTIKKVSSDVEELRFNTAISAMMVCVNEMDKAEKVSKEDYLAVVTLLSIFAPHVSQDLLEIFKIDGYISDQSWPKYDENLVVDDVVELAVQVNGKMRGNISLAPDAEESVAMEQAQQNESISKWISDGEVKKIVYVPGRILNIVVQ